MCVAFDGKRPYFYFNVVRTNLQLSPFIVPFVSFYSLQEQSIL
jgi:hypothetical protein